MGNKEEKNNTRITKQTNDQKKGDVRAIHDPLEIGYPGIINQ